MLLSRAVDRWKALSLGEQAVWVLVAWSLWTAMGLNVLLRSIDPQLAVDALAVRQRMTGSLPSPRDDELSEALGRDPWGRPWRWEERWDVGTTLGFEARWYQRVDAREARTRDEWYRHLGIWGRAVGGPRVGAVSVSFAQSLDPSKLEASELTAAKFLGVENWVQVDAALYSPGSNQLDEGGAGDDVVAREPSVPALLAAWNREIGLTLAVLLLWLVPWLRLKRSPRLAPELAKALLVAAPAIALIAWLLVRATQAGGTLRLERLLGVAPLVPWQLAVGGSLGLPVFLAALLLRLSRPLAAADSPKTPGEVPGDPLL